MRVVPCLCDDGPMLKELSNQLADAVASASPSVVQVHGRRRPASGLVFAPSVVVTTLGAIGSEEEGVKVRPHEGDATGAELVGWDPATGIAVLRVPALEAPPIAPSNAAVRVGHLVLALARSWSNAITVSAGIVSVIGGPLHTGRRRAIDQVFRTTAPMHDGFAGGALLDTSGGLAGIATAASIRGLRVVIPSSIAWKTAASVLEHGRVKRGFLGIAGQPAVLPDHQRDVSGRERGLLVVAVTPDGPASKAGVLVGDVLLSIDESPLESPEELLDLLLAKGAGHAATVKVLRGAALIEIAVSVGERPVR